MKIYTKTGDNGKTEVIGGQLDKDHPRVEALGTVDELNSLIGMSVTYLQDEHYADIVRDLGDIQQHLIDCCTELAMIEPELWGSRISADHVAALEKRVDHYNQEIRAIEQFILPGGNQAAAALHVCRTVTRRAERRVVTLSRQDEHLNQDVIRYFNRLSDLFFVLARVCNARAGVPDAPYIRKKP
jgi:cob(I)alamin adenosyltransferase